MAKLPWNAPKPRSTLRPKLPSCPLGGAVKAALLKILPPGYCDPKSSSGTPGFTSRRYLMGVRVAKEYPPVTSAGGAERGHFNIDSTSRQYWRIPPFTARPLVICSSCTRKRFSSKMKAVEGRLRQEGCHWAVRFCKKSKRAETQQQSEGEPTHLRSANMDPVISWWSNEPVRDQRE